MLKCISDVHQVAMVIAGGIYTFKNQDGMYGWENLGANCYQFKSFSVLITDNGSLQLEMEPNLGVATLSRGYGNH